MADSLIQFILYKKIASWLTLSYSQQSG